MSIAHHIREIGRGKDGTRSLGRADAFDLMSQVLAGTVSDLEIGAFAVAMRIKGESLPELLGFLDATHAHCRFIASERPTVVLPSYNGARRLPNLTPLLAHLLARQGVPVLVHGFREGLGRVTSLDIVEALGSSIARDAADVQGAWQRGEPAFVAIDDLCPPLARLLAVRQVIGLRNSGHTLAKLLAPLSGAPALRVVNYTHPEYADLLRDFMAQTFADALLMRGTEGEPVADPRRPTPLGFYVDGQPRPELAVPPPAEEDAPAALPPSLDAAATARHIQAVLAGTAPAPPALRAQLAGLLGTLAAMTQGRPDRPVAPA